MRTPSLLAPCGVQGHNRAKAPNLRGLSAMLTGPIHCASAWWSNRYKCRDGPIILATNPKSVDIQNFLLVEKLKIILGIFHLIYPMFEILVRVELYFTIEILSKNI
jgi:hypothetical protein